MFNERTVIVHNLIETPLAFSARSLHSKDSDMFNRLRTLTAAATLFTALAASAGAGSRRALSHPAPAPEFTGIDKWLNSEPLTLQQLRGKVVLVDFWTYIVHQLHEHAALREDLEPEVQGPGPGRGRRAYAGVSVRARHRTT